MSQKSLKTRLAQISDTGIYRLAAADSAKVEESAEALGFASFQVNLARCSDLNAILAALGQELGFPEWYGANLDALNDCLSDFSWREAKGYIVTLVGADSLSVDPDNFTALNEVFTAVIEQWREQGILFWVFYELGAADRANGLSSLPTLQ